MVADLAGIGIVGSGLDSFLLRDGLHYRNRFGELIFAPFAILLGLVIIFGALFKPEILGSTRSKR